MKIKHSLWFLLVASCLMMLFGFAGNDNGVAIAGSLVAAALFMIITQAVSKSEPKALPPSTRKNIVLIVGLGRSGKTTLIETITKEFNGKPPTASTKDFSITKSTSIINETGDIFEIQIADYRGQDLGQLIANVGGEQQASDSPVRVGKFNSLIFVVDIFDNESMPQRSRRSPVSQKRADFHLREWSTTALDAIFGMLEYPTLRYVCLFINKVDLVPDRKVEHLIKDKFRPLISDLEKRCRPNITFEVRLGSALDGRGVIGINDSLKSRLFQHSVSTSSTDNQIILTEAEPR